MKKLVRRCAMYEDRLKELGITLPPCPTPVASYVSGVITESWLVYISGQTPWLDGKQMTPGKVGKEVLIDNAYEGARRAMLLCISQLKETVGSLDKVKRIVKVNGWVNSEGDFGDQSLVINGASDLLVEIFGEKGRHARAAIGVSTLPSNACVEVELIVEI